MDKKVKGSWLIHHTNKLQGMRSQQGYENAFLSGKAGILLSAISSNNEATIGMARLNVLADAADINTMFELPKLLDVLKGRELVDLSATGVAVIGVTTSSALQHTSDIFDGLLPTPLENASLELAEMASIKPLQSKEASEMIADTHSLDNGQVTRDYLNKPRFSGGSS